MSNLQPALPLWEPEERSRAHHVDESCARAPLNPLNAGSRSDAGELTPSNACAASSTANSRARRGLSPNPDIRVPTPVAPGSSTSEAAALAIEPKRKGLRWLVLTTLASCTHPISREELSARTGIKESTLCARIAELKPTWVEAVPGACRSSAGITVDGYKLTPAARARMAKAA